MVDPHAARLRHGGFGVKRDARACKLKHAEIVGAIPYRDGIPRGEAETRGDAGQRLDLGLAPEDRLGDFAREATIAENQAVGTDFVKNRARRRWVERNP